MFLIIVYIIITIVSLTFLPQNVYVGATAITALTTIFYFVHRVITPSRKVLNGLIIATILLYIGFIVMLHVRGNAEGFTGQHGPCKTTTGKFGEYMNGECVSDHGGSSDSNSEEKIRRLEDKCDFLKHSGYPDKKQRIQRVTDQIAQLRNNRVLKAGICKVPCKNVFGYIIPEYGNRCLTTEQIDAMRKQNGVSTNRDLKKSVKKVRFADDYGKPLSLPLKSTGCLPKDNIKAFDNMCQDKYGQEYGVKSVKQYNCRDGYGIGECALNYRLTQYIPPEATKCYPDHSDFNYLCHSLNKENIESRSYNSGYKTLIRNGCPSRESRAICSDRYYGGKPVYVKATECMPSNTDFDELCAKEYGQKYGVERMDTNGCRQGNQRAFCNLMKK